MIQVELKITGVALENTLNRQAALDILHTVESYVLGQDGKIDISETVEEVLDVPSGERVIRNKQVLTAKGRFDE